MTTNLSALAVDAVATYRLTRLITTDTITSGLRNAAIRAAYIARDGSTAVIAWENRSEHEVWEDRAGDDYEAPAVAKLLTCSWCMGVWVAVAVSVARRVWPRWWRPVAETAAIAAAAGLLARDP